MKLKKGDNVMVMTGKDRGKSGKLLIVTNSRVTVENLNLAKKHRRPTKQGEKGQIIAVPRAIDSSNVMLICSGCKKPSRMGVKVDAKGGKTRVCKNCGVAN